MDGRDSRGDRGGDGEDVEESDDADIHLVDTHCHVHLPRDESEEHLHHPPHHHHHQPPPPYVRTCIFGTRESNWQSTIDAAERHGHVAVVGIGIHPWFAAETTSGWQDRLRAKLQEHPDVALGEIGLDKAYKRNGEVVDLDLQRQVFADQLAIAAALQRPVSVHCVRAHGHLMETLLRVPDLPPTIALHAFTGSVEIAQSLLRHPNTRDRVFFGFCKSVNYRNDRALEKLSGIIQKIPSENLLLESDSHDSSTILPDLNKIVAVISQVKQINSGQVVRIANANARRMFGVIVKRPL